MPLSTRSSRRFLLPLLAAPLLAGLAALLPGTGRAAEQFPSRPITIVVPFPPGGSTDVAARLLADRMSTSLGQAVTIDNRPGGQTVIGAEYVSRAAPDGYTLLMSSGTTLTLNPLLPERLPYRLEDFAPIGLITKLPFAVVLRQGLPDTIDGFVALAKSKPGQLNYGTNGPSSFNNLAAVLVWQGLGIRMQDVTYRGDSAQLNDLFAGTLDVMVVGGSSGLAAQRGGQGHIVGWTGDQRVPATPDVPNFSEKYPNTVAQTWFGLLAPARTPRAAVERINAAMQRALAEPELQRRLLAEGQFVAPGSPEDFARFLRDEQERWRPVIGQLGLARQ